MTKVNLYTKEQVDALIAGAGGGGFERVPKSEWSMLAQATDKDILYHIVIKKMDFFVLFDKGAISAGGRDTAMIFVMNPDPGQVLAYTVPISEPITSLATWGAVSGNSTTLSATPLKITLNNMSYEWTVDTAQIPFNFTVYLDKDDMGSGYNTIKVYKK